MRHRAAAPLWGALAIAAATLALPAPAHAAVEGFKVSITELPGEFRAGAKARTVEVVASTDNPGGCRKVRWSMVLKVDGVDLDQVKVNRVEDDGAFPLRVQSDGDTARLTDVRFDPGSLCRDKTVTARYQVAFDEDADEGRVTFQAQAFDATTRLLEEASASSRVVGGRAEASPSPKPSPSESASPEPEESPSADEESEPAAAGVAGLGDDDLADDLSATNVATEAGVPSLLGPGLIVGALLVFAGVGLLLRIKLRGRGRSAPGSPNPTGFYPAHR